VIPSDMGCFSKQMLQIMFLELDEDISEECIFWVDILLKTL